MNDLRSAFDKEYHEKKDGKYVNNSFALPIPMGDPRPENIFSQMQEAFKLITGIEDRTVKSYTRQSQFYILQLDSTP